MIKKRNEQEKNERGIALITTLLVSTILLALGMAVVFSATTDTVITKSQRVGEQAFFTADAGSAVARRALAQALEEEIAKIKDGTATYGTGGFYRKGTFPDIQVLPDPVADPNNVFYTNVYARANQLAQIEARKIKLKDINGSAFTVQYGKFSGTVSVVKTSSTKATETDVLRYSFQVTGTTEAGGKATVAETGRISTNINLTGGSSSGTDRTFSFSGFGAFFDNGDTISNAALAGGTFTGIVHTNTHFAFASSRTVSFRNRVSQVDDYIRYDSSDFNNGHQNIPGNSITGIDISSEGYKKVAQVPLPDNNYSQEYAVINGTGILDKNPDGTPVDPPAVIPKDLLGNLLPVFDSLGRVASQTLSANLRDASNNKPGLIGALLNNGVYVPSGDGVSISGAGIYVQGNADDIQLISNGGNQEYIIKQGSTKTTITVNPSANTTTITTGSNTRTFTGVPTDRFKSQSPKPAVSLFVNGAINSLRGGTNNGSVKPALAAGTRLTVTAQRDITITGDIKYQDAVANSDGTPVSNLNSIQNVLGIFTNDGNVNLSPNSSYVSSGLNLEINAAIATFNKNISNDGGQIEGSIVYTGSSSPGSNDRWKLVGSRVQAKINNIAYTNRDIFYDVRFSGGSFGPPFFPGTVYSLGEDNSGSTETAIASVASPTATGISWYRPNN